MTDQSIDQHFDSMGALSFEMENGQKLSVDVFMCTSCGSVVAVKEKHWATHESLPQPWVEE